MGLDRPTPHNFTLYPKETEFLHNPLSISDFLTSDQPKMAISGGLN
jgi:hypothetical protein